MGTNVPLMNVFEFCAWFGTVDQGDHGMSKEIAECLSIRAFPTSWMAIYGHLWMAPNRIMLDKSAPRV